MEKGKQVGSSSSSSFTVDLFGPKDSSKSSSSSTGLFGSIFGQPTSSVAAGRDTSRPDFGHAYAGGKHEAADYKTQKGDPMKKDKNSDYEDGMGEPCYFNSSIYYGGQEVYSSTDKNVSPPHNFKKDGGDVDPNESNSSCASRGNWWQGAGQDITLRIMENDEFCHQHFEQAKKPGSANLIGISVPILGQLLVYKFLFLGFQ